MNLGLVEPVGEDGCLDVEPSENTETLEAGLAIRDNERNEQKSFSDSDKKRRSKSNSTDKDD